MVQKDHLEDWAGFSGRASICRWFVRHFAEAQRRDPVNRGKFLRKVALIVKAILKSDLSNRFRGGEQIFSGLPETHLEMESGRGHVEDFFESSLEFTR